MRQLTIWGKALRLRFFSASLLPLFLGTVISGGGDGIISSGAWLLVLGVVLSAHGASNLLNDLYDDLYGTDRINQHYSPFNGGSRVLQEELISRSAMKRAIRLCYAVGTICLLLLSKLGGGWGVLLLGLAGFGCGYFYSVPPFRLAGTACGELLVGLAFGPLLVLGTTTGLTGVFSKEAVLVSLPVGALIAAVILINEFPVKINLLFVCLYLFSFQSAPSLPYFFKKG
ncbi:MAG: prenyltransferase [Firmicutes bacterium]|nr:prenyltransferase [Bacillota bacterium]